MTQAGDCDLTTIETNALNHDEESSITKVHNSDSLIVKEKINNYKKKMKSEVCEDDNESALYIEPLGRYFENNDDSDIEPIELLYEIQKGLLSSDSKLKVMLLTGEACVGKTLFCRHLQKALLYKLDYDHLQEPHEKAWLPIYIDLSKYNDPMLSAPINLTEILSKKLSLSEYEVDLLQNDQSDQSLPRLLLILDNIDHNYESDQKVAQSKGFWSEIGYKRNWKYTKMIISCREEAVSHIPHRHQFFGNFENEMKIPFKCEVSEIIIQPFNHHQILTYLIKYVVSDLFKKVIESYEISIPSASDSW